MMKLTNTIVPATVFALFAAGLLLGAQSAAARGFAVALDENGIALKGHDPVSYFVPGTPTKGRASHAATLEGATYWFASAENRSRFIAQPEKYTSARECII